MKILIVKRSEYCAFNPYQQKEGWRIHIETDDIMKPQLLLFATEE